MHKAFEYLAQSADADTPDARYGVSVRRADSTMSQRGVYERDAAPLAAPIAYNVTITPHLHRDADVREDRLKLEDKLVLRKKGGAEWVDAPEVLLLPHNGRMFDIRVDATGLPPGVHYEELQVRLCELCRAFRCKLCAGALNWPSSMLQGLLTSLHRACQSCKAFCFA